MCHRWYQQQRHPFALKEKRAPRENQPKLNNRDARNHLSGDRHQLDNRLRVYRSACWRATILLRVERAMQTR
jgi:hypothetical protein